MEDYVTALREKKIHKQDVRRRTWRKERDFGQPRSWWEHNIRQKWEK